MVMNGSEISCGSARVDVRSPNNPQSRHIAYCNLGSSDQGQDQK